ncbi:hypothetical protein Curi_c00420 [Gottschalkia acidurici 9a]|uniref:Uncharacterized protein n=1 Tax=Gottschalkia acidurici (strain ATCC 7906 / DSM 604 / BCRC 14475 / CIP 104303 / KCTC 5404 / NCIMB 10678 / 9a) TaxID=1128398 RepID=K0AV32_GOTA9|nr:hypothetical protein [Gottschalkia acidurici]AFS77124.1 hypothetical protein Curi_c00420 [Gottschalkia acidurici 9a]
MACSLPKTFQGGNIRYDLCGYSSGTDVEIRFELSTASHISIGRQDWIMYLDRKQSDGSWLQAGSRTGWISSSSPSDRVFTNVRSGKLRATVEMLDPDNVGFKYMSVEFNH